MKKKSRIPEFRTRDEEANFWDTHSFADYWDEFTPVDVAVELDKPKEDTLVLRLNKGIKEQLRKTAQQRGLNASSLVRMWVMEKLHTTSETSRSKQAF